MRPTAVLVKSLETHGRGHDRCTSAADEHSTQIQQYCRRLLRFCIANVSPRGVIVYLLEGQQGRFTAAKCRKVAECAVRQPCLMIRSALAACRSARHRCDPSRAARMIEGLAMLVTTQLFVLRYLARCNAVTSTCSELQSNAAKLCQVARDLRRSRGGPRRDR